MTIMPKDSGRDYLKKVRAQTNKEYEQIISDPITSNGVACSAEFTTYYSMYKK
jgi:hypothetical protein